MHRTVLPCLALVLFFAAGARAAEVPQVYLSEGELNYVGYLDADANQRLFALYDSLENKPSVLAIRSRGGDVMHGMALGSWVHAHKLDVKVMEFCMSSCANYVFTAAGRKIVGSAATIAFHGGLSSMSFTVGGSDKEAYAAMTQQQKDDYMATLRKSMEPAVAKEAAYFQSIGVRQEITTYGQQAKFKAIMAANDNTSGWTYSQEGFRRFGVEDIEVVNPPWAPRLLTMRTGIVRLDVE
jgi:hypothetical protein